MNQVNLPAELKDKNHIQNGVAKSMNPYVGISPETAQNIMHHAALASNYTNPFYPTFIYPRGIEGMMARQPGIPLGYGPQKG
jgi:hypothetical protein